MHSATTHVSTGTRPANSQATTKAIVNGFFADVAHDSGLRRTSSRSPASTRTRPATPPTTRPSPARWPTRNAYPTTRQLHGSQRSATTGRRIRNACSTDSCRTELSSFIAENGLPKGPTQLYFLLLPHNVATCLEEVEISGEQQVCSNNFFCAYHSYISPGSSERDHLCRHPFSLLDTASRRAVSQDGNPPSAAERRQGTSNNGNQVRRRRAEVHQPRVHRGRHRSARRTSTPPGSTKKAWRSGTSATASTYHPKKKANRL